MTLVVQNFSQMGLIGSAVTTTIKSTNLNNATTKICNPGIIAGPFSVVTTFAKASTCGNLENPSIKTTKFSWLNCSKCENS